MHPNRQMGNGLVFHTKIDMQTNPFQIIPLTYRLFCRNNVRDWLRKL